MAKKKPGKRYPSRENIRYVAITRALQEALAKFAADRSDEEDKKSISWAARIAIRRFLTEQGYKIEP